MKIQALFRGLRLNAIWAAFALVTAVRAEPAGSAALADTALRAFLTDPELCAYMLSAPDGESASVLRRYETAARDAVQQWRSRDASLSETAALFRLRAVCDASLGLASR